MQIVVVPLTLKRGSDILWSGTWRIPQYTSDEIAELKENFTLNFGDDDVELIDSLGFPTSVYDWIVSFTGFAYSFGWFVSYDTPSDRYFNNLKGLYPIVNYQDNVYNSLRRFTPDRDTGGYADYDNVHIYSGETDYGTTTIEVTGTDPGWGYNAGVDFDATGMSLSNLRLGCGFTMPWQVDRDASSEVYVPFRVVDDDGRVVKMGVHNFLYTTDGRYPYITYTSALFQIANEAPSSTNALEKALAANHVKFDPDDPYWQGGTSEEDLGGDANFDTDSDVIADSPFPTVSSANTGFTRIYNPTLSQIQSLANYLWTDPSIVQTLWNHIKQFLENPMDAFIAFNLVPCAVPNGGTTEFKVMYIGTGVQMTAAASQFVDVDCGSLAISKMYDSALDYSPYTKISIFLPFIGSVQLDTDDVMGKTISVKYRIDIVSGGCVAKVFVDDSIHYQYSGHCAVTIPFTSADFTGYISAMIQTAKAVTSIAAGAAGNTALAASMAGMPEQRTGKSTTTTTVSSRNPDTNRMRSVASTKVEKESVSGTEASFGSILANNFTNTVGTVMGSKSLVDRSGAFSGNTGYLGVRRPFVVIERPRMCNPAEYGKYNGRPSMLNLQLGNCSGFTQVQQVQLTGFSATNPELDEIGALLKSGVIL